MKQFIRILAAVLCLCLVLCACGNKAGGESKGESNTPGSSDFKVPENLMTTDEYHQELKNLLAVDNFSTADDDYLKKLDELGDRLEEMIRYNTDDLTECSGTKYYVSNNGDDNADGKTPETAWATLDKSNSAVLKEGDMVLFERGGFWRGYISAKNGVSYGAYGKGNKPKIWNSVNGKTGKWTETETENVWVYSEKIPVKDIGLVVFNEGTENVCYAEKVDSKKALKKDLQFVHMGGNASDRPLDNCVYLYSTEGNPAERFETIEISLGDDNITMAKGAHDILVNNLEFVYGSNGYFQTNLTNITMSYCISGFAGGIYNKKGGVRLGGGSGAWLTCDNLVYDHCYFYEQFDSGVTPQYDGNEETPAVFKNYITKDCLFEGCEYTLEYFNSQKNTTENRFENMYFGYNFCRKGGYGFGIKASASAYIKSWGHENSCYNCQIEYNVFDRAASKTLEIIGYEQSASGNTISYERIPKLNNNIYIQKKDKSFANINNVTYKFNEETYAELERLGVETGAVYMFTK